MNTLLRMLSSSFRYCFRAHAPDCQICTLLRRQARYYRCNGDEANIDIVRQGIVLQESVTGARLLRLYRDTGQSSISHS
jgi:hypothetical protein